MQIYKKMPFGREKIIRIEFFAIFFAPNLRTIYISKAAFLFLFVNLQ